MKSQCYRKSSTLDQQITQLKQKVPGGRHSSGAASRDPEFSSASKSLYSGHSNSKRDSTQLSTANESESLSDTGKTSIIFYNGISCHVALKDKTKMMHCNNMTCSE